MDKRYQVFVSSTYADLKKERSKVIQALLEMDCIPSGMELFPAADEEQWEFIKRVIDDCDYYLLIIGGRYGSIAPDGISYTEKEYNYAIENDIKVIALLHDEPDEIPVGKSDLDPVLRERLKRFRDKVASNRLVKFWKTADELPGLVALSLSKTIKTYPAIGWIRADRAPSEEVLSEINELRKENDRFKDQIAEFIRREKPQVQNLAGLDETITVRLTYKGHQETVVTVPWREVFAFIAPHLLRPPNDLSANLILGKNLWEKDKGVRLSASVHDEDFQTIKIQLMALNLVACEYGKTDKGGYDLFWTLTPKGKNLMLEVRSVKSKDRVRLFE